LQVTENGTVVVCPACTVALWGLPFVTVQFVGTAPSVTVYVPGGNEPLTLELGAISAFPPWGPLTSTV
jgi:hypothetical protein